MICEQLQEHLGLTCHPLNDEGSIAVVSTPFTFDDGDGLPVYVESTPDHIRFFDDGDVVMHFMGRGISFEDSRKTRFLKNIATAHDVAFTDDGQLEVWTKKAHAPAGFAKYMTALLAILEWEKSQKGASPDASFLVEEVAMCLRAWKPDATIESNPEYSGISGQTYELDLSIDGEAIIAISPHPASVSAALKKMVDIVSAPANADLSIKVVLDDRRQPNEAKTEGAILNAIATVLMMSRLEKLAQGSAILS
ncbi:MAG TPA: DUF1828 domain-containing protein [Burkholderiaceae bacterium]|nr:DUF1828 domain-containing protein [Burkholderiaceae bacterium]